MRRSLRTNRYAARIRRFDRSLEALSFDEGLPDHRLLLANVALQSVNCRLELSSGNPAAKTNVNRQQASDRVRVPLLEGHPHLRPKRRAAGPLHRLGHLPLQSLAYVLPTATAGFEASIPEAHCDYSLADTALVGTESAETCGYPTAGSASLIVYPSSLFAMTW